MTKPIPWIGTSWKMNKTRAEAREFARILKASPYALSPEFQPFVIPPFTAIADVAGELAHTRIKVGAQNMHWADHGAWTGEISASMIIDSGATLVEIGHSERRQHFGETDETVALKTQAALKHGLTALVCIGDSQVDYAAGKTAQVLDAQVRALLKYVGAVALGQVIIAYEPIWSIGEGGTPASPEFANEQHRKLNDLILSLIGGSLPILYGGSVNLDNCVELAAQSHINGLFIGRAAWQATGYLGIIEKVLGSQET